MNIHVASGRGRGLWARWLVAVASARCLLASVDTVPPTPFCGLECLCLRRR